MIYITGYEGVYSITKNGYVWSHKREKFLAFGSNSGGQYKSVCLSKCGKAKCFSVHRLVALHYIKNLSNKPEVNHIDGDKLNNHYKNLEWVTSSENSKHAHRTGLIKNIPSSRFISGFDPRRAAKRLLSDAEVVNMRKRSENGETFRSISEDFNIDESSVRRCCKRESYKDIL